MQWASALSQQNSLRAALSECAASIRANMGDTAADLAVVFAVFGVFLGLCQPSRAGCRTTGAPGSGAGVAPAAASSAAAARVEQEPAVSVTAASLPGVNIHPIRLESDNLPSLDAAPDDWHTALGVDPGDQPQFVLLADPMSFPAQNLLLGTGLRLSRRRQDWRVGQRGPGGLAKTACSWGAITTIPEPSASR